MIGGRSHPLAKALLFRYIAWKAGRTFAGKHWRIEPSFWEDPSSYPLILFSNHESWWDGLLEISLFTRFRLDYRVMMDAANLNTFWFFKYTGVFGVDRSSPKGRSAGLLAATRLLRDGSGKRRTLVIYPHGRLTEPYEPWPPFEPGLAAFARTVPEVTYLPLVKAVVWREKPRPEVFLQSGAPLTGRAVREDSGCLEKALRDSRDQLVEALRTREADRWDRFAIRG